MLYRPIGELFVRVSTWDTCVMFEDWIFMMTGDDTILDAGTLWECANALYLGHDWDYIVADLLDL